MSDRLLAQVRQLEAALSQASQRSSLYYTKTEIDTLLEDLMTPFAPGTTVSLAVTSASSRVALTGAEAGVQAKTVRIHNAGPFTAFIKFGDSTITAATTDMPIPAGAIENFNLPNSASNWYVAGITANGTATLYATVGTGV